MIANPTIHPSNIEWIRKEEEEFRSTIQAAINEKARLEASQAQCCVWNLETSMQLIHVLCEDDVKVAFLEQFNVSSRAQLDARSGPQPVGTVFDLAAERMNDLVFHPVSVLRTDRRFRIDVFSLTCGISF